MSCTHYKHYSVYDSNDEPIIIHAKADECSKALGVSVNTFYTYLSRFQHGKMYPKKIQIYVDEEID